MDIPAILDAQRQFFSSGKTRSFSFRKESLQKLLEAVLTHETAIFEALNADLGKGPAESFLGEVGFVQQEIRFTLKHLAKWVRPQRVVTPIVSAIGKSRIHYEPKGVVLIIGPWNYPFQLLVAPLVGAIAAGNCALLKPSELAPQTSRLVRELMSATFDPGFVAVVEGGVEVSQELLQHPYDHLFFTGGTEVGKIIMAAAAKHLTPVTLELGGKSPCLVAPDCDLDTAARRITWGKFFNAGQTCVAPDYVLAHRSIRDALVERIAKATEAFFGKNPAESPDYARIISERHFDRLLPMTREGTLAVGGDSDRPSRYLAPTVIKDPPREARVMAEEIFGPVLPVLAYDEWDEAIRQVKSRPKPLALYLFSKDKKRQRQVVEELSFGGGCVNDTLVHLTNPRLPFGGTGESGIGAYHGWYSFEVFSHRKSVLYRSFWPDLSLRYPPYEGRLPLFKRLMG